MLREQHLRKVEESLGEAIRAAKIAKLSDRELQEMLRMLLSVEESN